MPEIETNRIKYPKGWVLIEPTLRELQAKKREAENDSHDGKRKCQVLCPIFKIAHQKNRYVFDLYYRRHEISKELYEFCLDQESADRNLIAKWKKPLFGIRQYMRMTILRQCHSFRLTSCHLTPPNIISSTPRPSHQIVLRSKTEQLLLIKQYS